MKRFHFVTYPVAPRDRSRPPKLHARRDLCAGLELAFALMRLGYLPGEQVFQPTRLPEDDDEVLDLSLPFVHRRDLLLSFTRPPLSDFDSGPMRQIRRANTDLETRIFEAWKRFLAICARDHVQLHEDLLGAVRPGFEHCREMTFQQKGWGALYHEVNGHDGRGWRKRGGKRRVAKSALFLLRLPECWEGGPGLLSAFGMDGCTTLVWAYRLARDFKHLLERPGFVIAELDIGAMPARPSDLSFCQSWPIELALVHDLSPEPVLV